MEFVRPIDSVNEIQPSFFDLLAQSNFDNLLNQLIKSKLNNNSIFYSFKAAIDLLMLAGFGGITSEVVYGLERSCKRKWLLYLVTFLENHFFPFLSEICALKKISNFIPSKLLNPLKKLTVLLDILVKLAYITTDCKSFSLLHFLTGIGYKHTSVEIYERTDFTGRLVKSILITCQLGIFLYQSGVFEKLKNQKNQIILPSTAPDISKLIPKAHPEGFPSPQRAGICPLCLESWKNPVLLSSSGYVYCKACITKNDWKYCPITRTPITNLIPLFL